MLGQLGRALLATSAVYRSVSPSLLSPPPQAHGAHVLLDFAGFHDPEAPAASGSWMLETLRGAVAAHGVCEVHSKLVVLGERGESPPGFTAVTLLDESHVTAHCYSDRGWLAIDVFTCGGHDPRPLAASIRQHVEERAPGVRCLMHENVPRFHYDADYTETEAAPSKDVTAAATAAVAAASASTTSAAAASAGVASASAAAKPAAATDVAAMNVAAATASPSRPQTPGPASTIRLLRQRRRSTAGVMRASAPLVRMLAPSGEGEAPLEDSATPSPEDAAEGSSAGDAAGSALMASFASRLEEEGGAAKLQMQSERERASRAVKQSSSAAVKGLTSLVDLDSEKAKAARPEGGDGLLDVQSWRLTVAFFVLTIGLAFFSAATTDFGDGSTELGGSGAVEVTRGIDNAGVDYLLGRR